MKEYLCIRRCQFNGEIVGKGEKRQMTELEYAVPNVKASFTPVSEERRAAPAARTAPGQTKTSAKGPPKTDGDGSDAPPQGEGDGTGTQPDLIPPAPPSALDKDGDGPLLGPGGSPLPKNAQMDDDELRRRLDGMGVRYPATANRHQLFALLADALEPHTGGGTPAAKR